MYWIVSFLAPDPRFEIPVIKADNQGQIRPHSAPAEGRDGAGPGVTQPPLGRQQPRIKVLFSTAVSCCCYSYGAPDLPHEAAEERSWHQEEAARVLLQPALRAWEGAGSTSNQPCPQQPTVSTGSWRSKGEGLIQHNKDAFPKSHFCLCGEKVGSRIWEPETSPLHVTNTAQTARPAQLP